VTTVIRYESVPLTRVRLLRFRAVRLPLPAFVYIHLQMFPLSRGTVPSDKLQLLLAEK
jgi:hypothetical protein